MNGISSRYVRRIPKNIVFSIMLLFAYFMENTMFFGILLTYLLLIPFILMIVLNNQYHGLGILTINYKKMSSGSQIAE
jgi:hypothetical protein